MANPSYRQQARQFVKEARDELAASVDERLSYAALKLRFAMEAITYDRAVAYKDELPPSEYETWQPRRLLQVLLEIDPTADKDGSLAAAVEDGDGNPGSEVISFGTETVFNLGILKKHYDAMGNILHVPTLKQSQKPAPDPAKLRKRCEEVVAYLDQVLASPIWNITLGNFATVDCHCGAKIRKRFPTGQDKIDVECFECDASYTVTDVGDGKVEAVPQTAQAPCPSPGCGNSFALFRREMKPNISWACPKCGSKNVLRLSVVLLEEQPLSTATENQGSDKS